MRVGKHLIVDLYECDCNKKLLEDKRFLEELLEKAAEKSGSKVLNKFFYSHDNKVRGYVIIAESHLSIYTLPAEKCVFLEVFTCGSSNPWKGYEVIKKALKPRHDRVVELERPYAGGGI